MKNLIKNSIRVWDGMITVFPLHGQEKTVIQGISELVAKFNGCYAANNSTLAFIDDGCFYATPYTREAFSTLRSNGFTKNYFYVPFSNGDYPLMEQFTWELLRSNARKSYEEDFAKDCIRFSEEHHIGSLSEATLQCCFEMPKGGVQVTHSYYSDRYFPVLNGLCCDCVATQYLGHFCMNNGKVVFVYQDGRTFVAKGYGILQNLRSAGYKESGIFVPFSNGEKILDPVLAAKWNSLPKL